MDKVMLAVNGTLMRDLKLNNNLKEIGAKFIREDKTEECYRLWSINDEHPAMIRVSENGKSVDVEIWEVPKEGLVSILLKEPAGLCIGKVVLNDNSEVLGVVGESILCEDQLEITSFGGWRNFISKK